TVSGDAGRGAPELLGGAGLWHHDAHLLLLDARGLARDVADEIELGAADAAAAQHVDLGEHRAVHREDALDANAVGDLANRERLADPTAAARDAHALERLNALLLTFLDAHVHTQRIAGAEGRNIAE